MNNPKKIIAAITMLAFVFTQSGLAAQNLRLIEPENPADARRQVLKEEMAVAESGMIGSERQFRRELTNAMREHDEILSDDLIAAANRFGASRDELFKVVREIGASEEDGDTWGFLEVVTPDGIPTGALKRFSAIHSEKKGDWHAGTAVLLVTPDRRFVIPLRNDLRFDTSCGGHQQLGFTSDRTALSDIELNYNIKPHIARLHKITNPLTGEDVFRKIGSKNFKGGPYYADDGTFYCHSNENNNQEIDTLYVYILSEEELAQIDLEFSSDEESVSLDYRPANDLLRHSEANPDKYASGIPQYFYDERVRNHILSEIEKISSKEENSQKHIETLKRFERLIENDPLERLRQKSPLQAIFADLDNTTALSDEPTVVKTDGFIRDFIDLGGIFGVVTARAESTVRQRLRVPAILRGLTKEVRERFKIFPRFGAPVLSRQIHEKTNGKILTLTQVTNIAMAVADKLGLETTRRPRLIEKGPKKNPDMSHYRLGEIGIWILKDIPNNEKFFAIMTFKNAVEKAISSNLPDPREEYVEFIRKIFPWVDATVSGKNSINLALANKADLVEYAIREYGLQPEEVAVVDDEGTKYGGGYRMLSMNGVNAVLAGKKPDDLPKNAVLRSERNGPATLRRVLEIEIAKRNPHKPIRLLSEEETHQLKNFAQSPNKRVSNRAKKLISKLEKKEACLNALYKNNFYDEKIRKLFMDSGMDEELLFQLIINEAKLQGREFDEFVNNKGLMSKLIDEISEVVQSKPYNGICEIFTRAYGWPKEKLNRYLIYYAYDRRVSLKELLSGLVGKDAKAKFTEEFVKERYKGMKTDVVVIGGGHGSASMADKLRNEKKNNRAIRVTNVANSGDWGGGSWLLKWLMYRLYGVWIDMPGDYMNILGIGFAQAEHPAISSLLNTRFPAIEGKLEDSVYKGSIRELFVSTITDSVKNEGIKVDGQVISFISFCLGIADEMDKILPSDIWDYNDSDVWDYIDKEDGKLKNAISGNSIQNLLHIGVMLYVDAYQNRTIDEDKFLVGSYLLEQAAGVEEGRIIPAYFEGAESAMIYTRHSDEEFDEVVKGGVNAVLERAKRGESPFKNWVDDPKLANVTEYRLEPQPQANPVAVQEINKCKMVIIAPGNPYESVFTCLSAKGLAQALARAREDGKPVVWVLNPFSLLFDNSYSIEDYIVAMKKVIASATDRKVEEFDLGEYISHIVVNDPNTPGAEQVIEESMRRFEYLKKNTPTDYAKVSYKEPLGKVGLGTVEEDLPAIISEEKLGGITFFNALDPETVKQRIRGVDIKEAAYGEQLTDTIIGQYGQSEAVSSANAMGNAALVIGPEDDTRSTMVEELKAEYGNAAAGLNIREATANLDKEGDYQVIHIFYYGTTPPGQDMVNQLKSNFADAKVTFVNNLDKFYNILQDVVEEDA